MLLVSYIKLNVCVCARAKMYGVNHKIKYMFLYFFQQFFLSYYSRKFKGKGKNHKPLIYMNKSAFFIGGSPY